MKMAMCLKVLQKERNFSTNSDKKFVISKNPEKT